MSSTAISAQGTSVLVASGTTSSATITGAVIASGVATITATAHGFNKGDLVTLSAIGGLAALAGSFVIASVTANTFTVATTATGTYTTGGTAVANTYIQIENIKTFTGFDGSASEIDVSNLQSAAKELRLGLVDPGQFTMEVDQYNAGLGQTALRAAQVSGALTNLKLILPNLNTANFNAYVKKFSTQGGVDAVVKSSIDLRVSGPVAWV
jgi:hypothetical protein